MEAKRKRPCCPLVIPSIRRAQTKFKSGKVDTNFVGYFTRGVADLVTTVRKRLQVTVGDPIETEMPPGAHESILCESATLGSFPDPVSPAASSGAGLLPGRAFAVGGPDPEAGHRVTQRGCLFGHGLRRG